MSPISIDSSRIGTPVLLSCQYCDDYVWKAIKWQSGISSGTTLRPRLHLSERPVGTPYFWSTGQSFFESSGIFPVDPAA